MTDNEKRSGGGPILETPPIPYEPPQLTVIGRVEQLTTVCRVVLGSITGMALQPCPRHGSPQPDCPFCCS